MQLLVCLALFSLVSFSAAQDEVEPVLAVTARCYQGRLENGTGNMTMVDCSLSDGNSCQTKIEVNQGQVNVDRECKQTLACQNNMANNPAICYSADAIAKGTRVCHFCCSTDLCNDFTEIPAPAATPATLEETEAPEV